MCEMDRTFLTVDYKKYFDSFDRRFMKQFLERFGLPANLNEWVHQEYDKLQRCTKIGKTLGEPHTYANGYGQGDPLSLMTALAFVSAQFTRIQEKWPALRIGAVIDDRNIRGPLDQVVAAHNDMVMFDKAAGQSIEHDKTAVTATTEQSMKKLNETKLGGIAPKVCRHLLLVCDVISVTTKKLCNYADKRVHDALDIVARISSLPINKGLVLTALTTAAIPRMIYGTQWTMPSGRMTKAMRA